MTRARSARGRSSGAGTWRAARRRTSAARRRACRTRRCGSRSSACRKTTAPSRCTRRSSASPPPPSSRRPTRTARSRSGRAAPRTRRAREQPPGQPGPRLWNAVPVSTAALRLAAAPGGSAESRGMKPLCLRICSCSRARFTRPSAPRKSHGHLKPAASAAAPRTSPPARGPPAPRRGPRAAARPGTPAWRSIPAAARSDRGPARCRARRRLKSAARHPILAAALPTITHVG